MALPELAFCSIREVWAEGVVCCKNVQFTVKLYSLQLNCTVYSEIVQFTVKLYSLQFTLYLTVYSMKCTI